MDADILSGRLLFHPPCDRRNRRLPQAPCGTKAATFLWCPAWRKANQASVTSSPAKSFSIDTSPVDSPLSQRLIGRIVSLAMRPVPVCLGTRFPSLSSTSGGTALPVRTYIPLPPWSTAERTASQSNGPSCHSSINLGIAPSSNLSGRVSARMRLDFPTMGTWPPLRRPQHVYHSATEPSAWRQTGFFQLCGVLFSSTTRSLFTSTPRPGSLGS